MTEKWLPFDCIIRTDNSNHPTHFGISCLWGLFCSLKGNKTQRQVCLWQCSAHSYTVQELSVSNYFIFSECLWKSWLLQPWKLIPGRRETVWRDCQLPSFYLQQRCSLGLNCFVLTLLCLQPSTCSLKIHFPVCPGKTLHGVLRYYRDFSELGLHVQLSVHRYKVELGLFPWGNGIPVWNVLTPPSKREALLSGIQNTGRWLPGKEGHRTVAAL